MQKKNDKYKKICVRLLSFSDSRKSHIKIINLLYNLRFIASINKFTFLDPTKVKYEL